MDDVIDLTLDSDPEIDNGLEIAKKGNQRTSSLECRHFSSSSLKYMMQKLQHGRNGEKEPKCVQLSPNNGTVLLCLFNLRLPVELNCKY